MNRIYRLVFNRATGAMQVASELASGLSSPGRAVGATRRRSTLGVAVVAALGLGAASAPAFAVPYDFTADEVIGDTRAYADGFFIGNTGTVAIDLIGSGRLTSNGLVSLGTVAGANGTLRVIGPTAYLQMTGAALRVGEAGTGTLQLIDGGTATSNNTVSLGYGAGGTGNALVSGAGSSLTARQLLVGRQGTGTLDIDGGRVASTMAYTVVNNFGVSLGSDTAGSGTINVRNGGELIVTDNNLLVGQVGQGRLNVDGGRVEAGRGIYVGAGTQSGATQGGRGEITVSGGGQLVSQDLVLGTSNNAAGTLTVSGAGSVVDATIVRVGQNGDGTLRVEGGGVVSADEVNAEKYDALGSGDFGQTGSIVVTGAGSAIRAARVDASNHLLLEAGGVIESDRAAIKDSFGPTASTARITGADTRWTNTGVMAISTNLDVLDGAVIRSDSVNISGGLNDVTMSPALLDEQTRVSGAGSAIEAVNGLTVGAVLMRGPYGMLSVNNGGRVAGGSGILLDQSGYLVLGGGMATWSVADGGPQWLAAEQAGTLDGAAISMDGNAGGLVFNHTGDITLGNTIQTVSSGTSNGHLHGGALTQVAGNTTLDGDLRAFGGDITVNGGSLVINSDMYTGAGYAGPSQAVQQLIDVRGGTLVLNGAAGFQQNIDFGPGLGSEVRRSSLAEVSGSGVLAGNATVGTTYVRNGGALSPGNAGVGTMTIDGDLFYNANGLLPEQVANKAFFDVDVLGNGQADLLTVSGKAYIGRGANVGQMGDTGVRVTALDPATSYQDGQTYTILSAAQGVAGTFDDVISRSAFLDTSLSYTANDVRLNIAVKGTGPVDPPVDPPLDPVDPPVEPPVDPITPPVDPITPPPPPLEVFVTAAATGNQLATAAALDTLQQSGEALALYNRLLMLDADSARLAFDDLSGEIHASNRALLLEDRFLRDGISQRLRSGMPAGDGPSAWIGGSGASSQRDGNGSAARTRDHRQGLMAGADWSIGERWTVGVAGGPESLRQQVNARNATTDVDAVHGGLYVGFRGDTAYLNGGASYADYQLDTRRTVGAGTAWGQSLANRRDAHAVSGFVEGGWDFQIDDAMTLTPYVAVAYTRLSTDAGVETGGNAALAIAASKDEAWTTTAGVRAAWDISGGQQDGARLEAGLAWQNAAGELRADSTHRFVAGSDGFTVQGLPLARNVGIAELGVSVNTSSRSRLSFAAQGRAGDGQREVGAQLNWNVAF